MAPPLLTVPGYGDSGPAHWHTAWEARFPGARRVVQRDWERPELEAWVGSLMAALAACTEPPVLACHSLGCLVLAHAAARSAGTVRAALLVAPPNPDRLEVLRGFGPVPMGALPFPSIVVASSNDPFARLEFARELARAWGSRLVEAGPRGHLDSAAGLGDWPAGLALLAELGFDGI
jgi:predicted alpha/beta hydrolase family esterase